MKSLSVLASYGGSIGLARLWPAAILILACIGGLFSLAARNSELAESQKADASSKSSAPKDWTTPSKTRRVVTLRGDRSNASGRLMVPGTPRDDTLVLDYSRGNPVPKGGLLFDGGAQKTKDGDVLIIEGGHFDRIVHDLINKSSADINLDGRRVAYRGLEPVLTNTGSVTDVVFNLPAGAGIAGLDDDGTPGNNISRLQGSDFEVTDFGHPSGSLTINGTDNGDIVVVQPVDSFGSANVTVASGRIEANRLTTSGTLRVNAFANTITQPAGPLMVGALGVRAASTITLGQAANQIGTLAATGPADITVVSSTSTTVGQVTAPSISPGSFPVTTGITTGTFSEIFLTIGGALAITQQITASNSSGTVTLSVKDGTTQTARIVSRELMLSTSGAAGNGDWELTHPNNSVQNFAADADQRPGQDVRLVTTAQLALQPLAGSTLGSGPGVDTDGGDVEIQAPTLSLFRPIQGNFVRLGAATHIDSNASQGGEISANALGLKYGGAGVVSVDSSSPLSLAVDGGAGLRLATGAPVTLTTMAATGIFPALAGIDMTGDVRLLANGLTQTASAPVLAGSLGVNSDGVITLNQAPNVVSHVAMLAGSNLAFTTTTGLTVGLMPAESTGVGNFPLVDGVRAPSGASAVTLTAANPAGASPINVARLLQAEGPLTLTATDAAGTGSDITLADNQNIVANGAIALRAGDNISLPANGQVVTSAVPVTFTTDFGDADPGVGTTNQLRALMNGAPVVANGGPDADVFQVGPFPGGVGVQRLAGGGGSDTYALSGTGSSIVGDPHAIIDEAPGCEDADVIDLSTATGPATLDLASTSVQTVIPSFFKLQFLNASAVEQIVGTPQNDTLAGNVCDNVINGGAGTNTITDPTPGPTPLIADYRFDDSRASSVAGAPPLSDLLGGSNAGNTFATETIGGQPNRVLTFPAGNGLHLPDTGGFFTTNGNRATEYSVVMRLRLANVDSYRRLLNFRDPTGLAGTDDGLYVANGQADFYDFAGGGDHVGASAPFSPNGYVELAFVRHAGVNPVTQVYVNGTKEINYTDANDIAELTTDGLRFFTDDSTGFPNEFSAGAVARIRVYERALQKSEIVALAGQADPSVDDDGDGVLNHNDNCPAASNANQANFDSDALGDACDDADGDGAVDATDNCRSAANGNQADFDSDGAGDACDDSDADTVLDAADNCRSAANGDQANLDTDTQGDACDDDDDADGVADASDKCPSTADAAQQDTDGDGQGNACDTDDDGDGVADGSDKCPTTADAGQQDSDGDGQGNACDADDDGDGVPDTTDACPLVVRAGLNGCPAAQVQRAGKVRTRRAGRRGITVLSGLRAVCPLSPLNCSAKGSVARKRLKLGAVTIRQLRPGTTKLINIKLTKKGAAALRKAGRMKVKIVVTATGADGKVVRVTRTATIKPPR